MSLTKKQKERIEELKNSIDYLEPSQMENIKNMLKYYMQKPEEESQRQSLDDEIKKLLDIAEVNKKAHMHKLQQQKD